MASRHSYAGAGVLQRNDSWASSPWGADEDALFSGGLGGEGTTVVQSSSPMPKGASDDEEMGEISDEDMDMGALGNKSFGVQMQEVDEEDMFFGNASYEEWDMERRRKNGVPVRSGEDDGGLGGAGDDSFSSSFGVGSWGGAPSFSLKDGLPKRGAHGRHSSDSSEETGSFLAGLNLPPPKLEKKYRPRDSGVGLSDFDSDLSTASSNGAIAPLPLGGLRGKMKDDGRGGRGRPSFGRSESVANAFAMDAASSTMPMPRASTSVSTIASSDQDNDYHDLVTPGFEPTSASGWPNFHDPGPFLPSTNSTTFSSNAAARGHGQPGVVSASNSGNSLEGAIAHGALRMDSEVDTFILRTLLLAQSNKYEHHHYSDDHLAGLGDVSMGGGAAHVGGGGPGHGGKKPPGTPQKKVKTAFKFGTGGERPWQSAVTTKVVNFEEFVGEKGVGAGLGVGGVAGEAVTGARPAGKKKTKIPRKSLPAAFPMLGGKGKKAQALQMMNSKVEDDSDEEGLVVVDASPSEKYDGLGLGRPTAVAGRSWLLRRSSSGALSTFSNGSKNSDDSSPGTPTADKSGGELHYLDCLFFISAL